MDKQKEEQKACLHCHELMDVLGPELLTSNIFSYLIQKFFWKHSKFLTLNKNSEN